MEWIVVPILTLVGIIFGILGKGWYETKFKKLDEASTIRKELREELTNLRKYFQELQELRVRYADLDIACSRCISRLEECVDFISLLLEADQCLSEHNVKRAKVLLHLVERDKKMRAELDLRPKSVTSDK